MSDWNLFQICKRQFGWKIIIIILSLIFLQAFTVSGDEISNYDSEVNRIMSYIDSDCIRDFESFSVPDGFIAKDFTLTTLDDGFNCQTGEKILNQGCTIEEYESGKQVYSYYQVYGKDPSEELGSLSDLELKPGVYLLTVGGGTNAVAIMTYKLVKGQGDDNEEISGEVSSPCSFPKLDAFIKENNGKWIDDFVIDLGGGIEKDTKYAERYLATYKTFTKNGDEIEIYIQEQHAKSNTEALCERASGSILNVPSNYCPTNCKGDKFFVGYYPKEDFFIFIRSDKNLGFSFKDLAEKIICNHEHQ